MSPSVREPVSDVDLLDVLKDRMSSAVVDAVKDRIRSAQAFQQRLEVAERERDEARAHARVLAHSYAHDSRPPRAVVDAALAYPVRPSQAPVAGCWADCATLVRLVGALVRAAGGVVRLPYLDVEREPKGVLEITEQPGSSEIEMVWELKDDATPIAPGEERRARLCRRCGFAVPWPGETDDDYVCGGCTCPVPNLER
jgi:hypothetical protein